MDVNKSKCEVLSVTRNVKPVKFSYLLKDIPISKTNVQKDLGVVISSDLKWNQHVSTVSAKANKMLGYIKRSSLDIRNEKTRLALYKTMTKINDLTHKRFEKVSQRSHKSSAKSSISKLSKVSSISSRQAAANAAGLKQRMTSLIKQQELEREREELQLLQRELERQGDQERLQGEINAVVAIHDTLVEDTKLPSNNHPKLLPINPNTIQPSTSYQDPSISQTSQVNTKENTNVGSVARQLDPKIPAFQPASMSASQLTQPVPHSTDVMGQNERDGVEIQVQQIELIKRMSLCAPKPPVFSGNILELTK
ncbi:Hypothetical predicted protein [Paramuricea clavata]|uniref:Uncharacterized protein n=1 Tax=Paramuricea clavata TaxID=317549 RepID=A0A7D9D8J3_PARCT|nr:Hypothetical predicted protein [Paramuricea clavata]